MPLTAHQLNTFRHQIEHGYSSGSNAGFPRLIFIVYMQLEDERDVDALLNTLKPETLKAAQKALADLALKIHKIQTAQNIADRRSHYFHGRTTEPFIE